MSKRPRDRKEDVGSASALGGAQILLGILSVGAIVLAAMGYRETRTLTAKLAEVEGRVGQVDTRVGQVQTKLESALGQAGRRAGPDPEKAYPINVAGSPSKGSQSAVVTIAEFSDFQCPFCSRVGPTMDRIQKVYGDKVRVVWKHLPLAMHKDAPLAHLASAAAAEQGKFWEYHDKLFANQAKLGRPFLVQYAKDLGLDVARFEQALATGRGQERIDADLAESRTLGVGGTPAFFVNGYFLSGAKPFEEFAKAINRELTRLGLPIPPEAAVPG